MLKVDRSKQRQGFRTVIPKHYSEDQQLLSTTQHSRGSKSERVPISNGQACSVHSSDHSKIELSLA